jgi:transcriptional regulator with XRE-family HTH domain
MRTAMHILHAAVHHPRNGCNVPIVYGTPLQHVQQCCYGVRMRADAPAQSPDTPGAALRALREKTPHSIRDVARELGWQPSKISRIERSLSGVKPDDLDKLLDFYQAPRATRSAIGALVEETKRRPRESSPAIPDAYEAYTRFEAQATEISIYAAIVLPGLFQVPEYAEAIIAATPTPENQFATERMETRLKRQALLARTPRPRLNVIIDETVFRRLIGGRTVMRYQKLRLHELSQRPEITIRVLPFSVGAHPGLDGHFAILDFAPEAAIPPQVFCGGLTGGVLRDSSGDVERYRACFAALDRLALDVEHSATFFTAPKR